MKLSMFLRRAKLKVLHVHAHLLTAEVMNVHSTSGAVKTLPGCSMGITAGRGVVTVFATLSSRPDVTGAAESAVLFNPHGLTSFCGGTRTYPTNTTVWKEAIIYGF
jgi:hypothetical protein